MDSFLKFLGFFGAILFLGFLIELVFIVVLTIAQWKLFKKAGKKGWKALIPFYSLWVLIEIAGLNWWYFLISISSLVFSILGGLASLFVNFLIFYNLAKKTGKNEKTYGILAIFFSGILVLILGFSKSVTFDNTVAVSPNGPFGEGKTDATNSTNSTTNNVNTNVNTINNTTTTTTATTTKVCSNCGQPIRENTSFCTNCGQKVE